MWYNRGVAIVAQLVEQLIRNEQVTGSIPANGSIFCDELLYGLKGGTQDVDIKMSPEYFEEDPDGIGYRG